MILWICIAIFVALLIIGAPIILCLGIPPIIWLLQNGRVPNMVMGQKMYTAVDSFSLMAIPFFMLAGQVMERTGITEAIVDFANAVIGWVRGGLACTVELAGMLMAGISGSSNADASALGAICLRALKKGGYEEGWAAAIVVSASGIGPIIPPSIIMIVYATAAGLDIGQLFTAGIVPGICLGVAYMLVSVNYAKRHNIPKIPFKGFKHVWENLKKAIWALLMQVIIIGGILGGVFTATEAGIVACIYGLICGLAIYRTIRIRELPRMFRSATEGTCMIMMIMGIAAVYGYIFAIENVGTIVTEWMLSITTNKYLIQLMILALMTLIGMFMETVAAMTVLLPVIYPLAMQVGVDPIGFGVWYCISTVLGGLTPPVGVYLFQSMGIVPAKFKEVVPYMIPIVIVVIITMLLIVFVPGIASWLPNAVM